MTTDGQPETTAYIFGGDLLTMINRCAELGIDVDPDSRPTDSKIRYIGKWNGVPVYLDQELPPFKMLITRKNKESDTP